MEELLYTCSDVARSHIKSGNSKALILAVGVSPNSLLPCPKCMTTFMIHFFSADHAYISGHVPHHRCCNRVMLQDISVLGVHYGACMWLDLH